MTAGFMKEKGSRVLVIKRVVDAVKRRDVVRACSSERRHQEREKIRAIG